MHLTSHAITLLYSPHVLPFPDLALLLVHESVHIAKTLTAKIYETRHHAGVRPAPGSTLTARQLPQNALAPACASI